MTAIETETKPSTADVDFFAAKIQEIFPKLEADSRQVAVILYRLLGGKDSVSRDELAQAAGLSVEKVNGILENWSGIYYEEDQIIGFWGLTSRPFSKHLLHYDGTTAYGWCAWDTLFIPELLGKTVEVKSTDPESGQVVNLTVTPDAVKSVSPEEVVMSILEPTEEMTEDVVANFCHYIYFFPSREIGAKWVAKNPGTVLLTLDDAFELAKRRNRFQFQEALDIPFE